MSRSPDVALLVSRFLSAIVFILVASYWFAEPVWLLERDAITISLLFAAAMLLSIGISRAWTIQGQTVVRAVLAAFGYAVLATALIAAVHLMFDLRVSRFLLIIDAALLLALLLANYSGLGRKITIAVNLLAVAVGLAPQLTASSISSFRETVLNIRSIEFDNSVDYVYSSRHDIKLTRFEVEPDSRQLLGGGISLIGEQRLLLGVGDGRFFVVSYDDGIPAALPVPFKVPLNRDEYIADNKNPSRHFRVTDTFVAPDDGHIRSLFASHHHWNREGACLTLRLSEIKIDVRSMEAVDENWQTRYESSPCLSVGDGFFNNENGGRIAQLAPDTLLMSVGSHGFDSAVADVAKYDASSYGKMIEIKRQDWRHNVFSSGHRNPQGLLVEEGEIWATEHGPHGGDELNLLRRGTHYGWPYSTYGTAYGRKSWPRSSDPDVHARGQKPVYTWVPSIATSNLIRVTSAAFPSWQGDLLVSSLAGLGNGRSLFRVKLVEQRVILVERIPVGHTVRDLTEIEDGRIVLWDGSNALIIVEASNHVFSECNGCHTLRWQSHGIGPDLMGIVGERVARHGDFPYSEALLGFGGRWTTDRLDAYLENPSAVVPGTSMQFPGIEDAERRAQIIQYLAELPSTN